MKLAHELRYAIKVSLSVFAAILFCAYNANMVEPTGVALAAFLVTNSAYKEPWRHGLIVLVVMILALFCAGLMMTSHIVAVGFLPLILFFSAALFLLQPGSSLYIRNNAVIFALIVMIILIGPMQANDNTLRTEIANISVGGVIGLLCLFFIFPFRSAHEFRRGIIPALMKLHQYAEHLNPQNKIAVQKALIHYPYPNWIYEPGFNPSLRGGFRFFLIHFEQIVDLYFVLGDLYTQVQPAFSRAEAFVNVQRKNAELIALLLDYFVNHQLKDNAADQLELTDDIITMEKNVLKLMPRSVEMLDLTPEYLQMKSFVQTHKDIRKQLTDLLFSLPYRGAI